MANITNAPMAYITVNKGRTKIKKDKFVYLENGTEFEIELFNPTQTTVLAKISINNKLISFSGIVLRPGERVFLERHLDNSNKFKFETYEVGGNSEEVKKAIELNGLVKVEFYNEDLSINYRSNPIITTNGGGWSTTNTPTWTLGNTYYGGTAVGSSGTFTGSLTNTTSSMFFSEPTNTTYSTNSLDISGGLAEPKKSLKRSVKAKLETGRVEEGSHSNQSFQTVNKKFYYYTTNVVEIQIKPVSQMYVDSKDINKMNKFCVKCGRKTKQNDNFCAGCGNRF
jgi:hypothetical protein